MSCYIQNSFDSLIVSSFCLFWKHEMFFTSSQLFLHKVVNFQIHLTKALIWWFLQLTKFRFIASTLLCVVTARNNASKNANNEWNLSLEWSLLKHVHLKTECRLKRVLCAPLLLPFKELFIIFEFLSQRYNVSARRYATNDSKQW